MPDLTLIEQLADNTGTPPQQEFRIAVSGGPKSGLDGDSWLFIIFRCAHTGLPEYFALCPGLAKELGAKLVDFYAGVKGDGSGKSGAE